MLRLILVILLAAAGSAGGIWGGFMFAGRPKPEGSAEAVAEKKHVIEYLTPELFVVPVITSTEIKGFLVCRLVFAADAALPLKNTIDEDTLMADVFYTTAFNGPAYGANEDKIPDLNSVADQILKRMNEVAGNGRYSQILIQQVDFFRRSDIRRKVVQERLVKD